MSGHFLGAVELPRGMVWEDEFAWQAVETSTDRGITGALIIDAFALTAGRPITLVGSDGAGWSGMTRAKVIALKAMADAMVDPALTYTLTHSDGRTFTVRFAAGANPIDARPLARPELPPETYPYVVTVRLITVA